MKKLFILITFIFLNIAQAQIIDECKTDIYFGNGVWNSSEQAKDSIREMNRKIINPFIIKNSPILKAKYGEVQLQYNWGQGYMLDVLETYYQLKESGQVNGIEFFALMTLLFNGNPIPATISTVMYQLRESAIIMDEQANTVEMFQKYYEESFKYGHRVLLVSHSQGNLFANRVHEKITPSQYQNYFANLQVASPSSEVKASKGDYVTGFIDPVINPIPGSMSSNANLDFPGGHKFVEAYLASEDSLIKITTKIKQLLASLDAEPSQWETAEEFNKGTISYKIKVKHKFDPSIVMSEQVYPFAPSEKLYYVSIGTIPGYVKASCGGTEISASWTGKQDNEFYMINNPEKEKITVKTTETVQYVLPLYNQDKSLEEHSFIIDDNATQVLISLYSYEPCGYMLNGNYIPYQIYVRVNNQNVVTMEYPNIVEEDFLNVDITDVVNYGENTIEASCYSYDNPFPEYDSVSVEIKSFF